MQLVATTTVSVLRGTETDTYGDEQDTIDVVSTGTPASIIEGRQNVLTGADNIPRVVRIFKLRAPAYLDVRRGDRIKDERNGEIYIVDAPVRVQNPAYTTDLRVDLRRVGNANELET